jgi:O-antigen/teichoic acid export membrane protein
VIARVFKSLNALLFGQVIVRVGSIIIVPIFLRNWGAAAYGEYLTIFALISYFATLDIGISQAAVNRLTQAFARKDVDGYRQLFHSSLAFYFAVASLGTVILLLAANVLPIPRWLGLNSTPSDVAFKVVIILGIVAIWGMPIKFIMGIHRTVGDLAFSQWLMNSNQLLTLALIAAALMTGSGMVGVSLVQLVPMFLLPLVSIAYLQRRFEGIQMGLAGARLSQVSEVARLGFLFYVLTLCNLATFQGSTLLVAGFLGGVGVATFSVVRTLASIIRTGVDAFTSAFWPEITRLDETDQLKKLRAVHRFIIGGCLVICLGFAGLLWFEGEDLIDAWTRGQLHPQPWLLRLMVLMVVLEVPWLAGYAVAGATNRHRKLAIAYAWSSGIGIITACLLVPHIGIMGIPVGLMTGEVFICAHFILKSTCELLDENYPVFALRVWSALLASGAFVLAISWGVHWDLGSVNPLLRALLVGAISFAASIFATWVLWFNAEERKWLVSSLAAPAYRFLVARD